MGLSSKRHYSKALYSCILLNALVGMSFFTFPDMVKAFLSAPASKIIIAIFILIQIIVVFSVLKKIRSINFKKKEMIE